MIRKNVIIIIPSILRLLLLLLSFHNEPSVVVARVVVTECTTTKNADNTNNIVPPDGKSSNNNNRIPIGIASCRHDYADNDDDSVEVVKQEPLVEAEKFRFQRYQSPLSIRNAFRQIMNDKKMHFFIGKDGRKGYVSSKRLGGDWVYARSEQVAVSTTTHEVLKAYLTESLQEKWNTKDVIQCKINCKDIINSNALEEKEQQQKGGRGFPSLLLRNNNNNIQKRYNNNNNLAPCKDIINTSTLEEKEKQQKGGRGFPSLLLRNNNNNIQKRNNNNNNLGKYYQQDLVLKSKRVIRSHTGIMKYTQAITIDQINDNDNSNYCVIVKLQRGNNKPFNSLLAHVGLEQNGDDVNIYVDGVMKVNRKVIPNLIVFDASGIAGSMAGKASLWLSAHFDERRRKKSN